MRNKKAFTLIELLVVISIIVLLILGASAYVQKIRAKARDAQRLAHLYQLITAIEMYHSKYGSFLSFPAQCIVPQNEFDGDSDDLENALSPFLNKIPKDPLHNCSCDNCNSDEFFYAFDPDVPDCGPAISINRFETQEYKNIYGRKSTDQGKMNIGGADFNWCFGK